MSAPVSTSREDRGERPGAVLECCSDRVCSGLGASAAQISTLGAGAPELVALLLSPIDQARAARTERSMPWRTRKHREKGDPTALGAPLRQGVRVHEVQKPLDHGWR